MSNQLAKASIYACARLGGYLTTEELNTPGKMHTHCMTNHSASVVPAMFGFGTCRIVSCTYLGANQIILHRTIYNSVLSIFQRLLITCIPFCFEMNKVFLAIPYSGNIIIDLQTDYRNTITKASNLVGSDN